MTTQLDAFVDLFQKWNRRINLSAASNRREVQEHLEDSLHVVPLLAGLERIVDVGSGGGFPVIIAAISVPTSSFTALEPIHKKAAFLRTAVRELSLPNLDVFTERVEDHAERDYDAAMSRATFDLSEWLDIGSGLIRAGGIVIGFEALQRADLTDVERIPYELRGKSRQLVIRRNVPRGT